MHVLTADVIELHRVKNLVNFCLVTPEITRLICIPMYLYLAKINLHTFIHSAAVQKRHGVLER